MVVLGGPGTLVGGLIGATVVVFLREYLATVVQWWQYVLGAVYVRRSCTCPAESWVSSKEEQTMKRKLLAVVAALALGRGLRLHRS